MKPTSRCQPWIDADAAVAQLASAADMLAVAVTRGASAAGKLALVVA